MRIRFIYIPITFWIIYYILLTTVVKPQDAYGSKRIGHSVRFATHTNIPCIIRWNQTLLLFIVSSLWQFIVIDVVAHRRNGWDSFISQCKPICRRVCLFSIFIINMTVHECSVDDCCWFPTDFFRSGVELSEHFENDLRCLPYFTIISCHLSTENSCTFL